MFTIRPLGREVKGQCAQTERGCGNVEVSHKCFRHQNFRLSQILKLEQILALYIFKLSWFQAGALALFQTTVLRGTVFRCSCTVIVAALWLLRAWCIVIGAGSYPQWTSIYWYDKKHLSILYVYIFWVNIQYRTSTVAIDRHRKQRHLLVWVITWSIITDEIPHSFWLEKKVTFMSLFRCTCHQMCCSRSQC